MAESETASARPWRSSPWVKRLPLLVVAAVGILFMAKFMPAETAFVYELGAKRAGLATLEVSISSLPDKQLVRKTEYRFTAEHPAPEALRHSLQLAPGEYQLEVTLDYGGKKEHLSKPVKFDREEQIALAL